MYSRPREKPAHIGGKWMEVSSKEVSKKNKLELLPYVAKLN